MFFDYQLKYVKCVTLNLKLNIEKKWLNFFYSILNGFNIYKM